MISIIRRVIRLFSNVSENSERLGGDEIYPIHFIDHAAAIQPCIVNYTFRYQNVLCANKLRDSLVALMDTGDWRKLRGRLRMNRNGRLEIHVPPSHSSQRPAVRFSHVRFEVDIEEHPQACQLPKQRNDRPSISMGYYNFLQFSTAPDQPQSVEQYLTTDEPLLYLYITTFTDATLVSITFPHAICDVMGMAALLAAWSSVISGRAAEIPPLLGNREDVIEAVRYSDGKSATSFVLEGVRLTGLSMMSFVIRHVWDTLVTPKMDGGFIFLPAAFISHLRRQAEAELMRRKETVESVSFVSDGDLITAWGSHMVMSSRSTARSAVIVNVFDMRTRLGGSVINTAGTYLQNLIMSSSAILPQTAVATESPAQIAVRVRSALASQTTEAQVQQLARLGCASGIGTPLFGYADSMMISWTSWTKAQLSKAAAGLGTLVDDPNKNAITTASNDQYLTHWGAGINMGNKFRDGFVIYDKTREGGYWLHGFLRKSTWDLIRFEFDKFPQPNASLR